MAQSKNNIITHGMSGMIGDMLVFRQVGSRTIVTTAPRDRGDDPGTPAQQAVRARFQQAILYGRAAMADPDKKDAYGAAAGEGQSAFNVAVADFYHAPDIHEVDLTHYTGAVGSTIRIKASDDFGVFGVTVRIENSDGTLVEQAAATLPAGGTDYIYTATVANTSTAGDKIIVTVDDYAGNHTVEARTL